jgi:formylglycine-generating enzyme required for sulfatase activity
MRTVEVSPFDIAAHTVTNAQFGEFVRRTGSETDAERFNWSFVFSAFVGEEVKRRVQRVPADTPWWLPIPRAYWVQPEGPRSTALDRLDHPVVHVSWNDAQAYCQWFCTRLPTEANGSSPLVVAWTKTSTRGETNLRLTANITATYGKAPSVSQCDG